MNGVWVSHSNYMKNEEIFSVYTCLYKKERSYNEMGSNNLTWWHKK